MHLLQLAKLGGQSVDWEQPDCGEKLRFLLYNENGAGALDHFTHSQCIARLQGFCSGLPCCGALAGTLLAAPVWPGLCSCALRRRKGRRGGGVHLSWRCSAVTKRWAMRGLQAAEKSRPLMGHVRSMSVLPSCITHSSQWWSRMVCLELGSELRADAGRWPVAM